MLTPIDHYAREVTSSAQYAIVHAPTFNLEDDNFLLPDQSELAIHELHISTCNDEDPCRLGHLISITARLEHLK
jgi:hypothetical protein